MLENIEGVVIKTRNYGETHKIITIFSHKLGKLNGIARGSNRPKSRMAAVTQPFIYGNYLVYVSRGLSTIQQGETLEYFRKIREDIIKTAYVAYIMELTDKLMEEKQPEPFIYQQFIQTLHWVNDFSGAEFNIEIPIMMYELKLYAYGGFAPVVEHCANCQNKHKQIVSFSIQFGGLLCLECSSKDQRAIRISQNMAKLFHLLRHITIERLGNISVKEKNIQFMRKIINSYYDTYGSYYLKSRNFLKQLDLLK